MRNTAGSVTPPPSSRRRRSRPGWNGGGGVGPGAARPPSWKVVATAVLLGLLATAVTLVLLQSAGVISWSFLGPTA